MTGEWIEVTFCHPEECEHCHGCDGGHKASVLTLRGEGRVGDGAVVDLPDETLVKASLLGYLIPIAGLLLGMAIGRLVFSSDIIAAIGGAIGLAIPAGYVALTEKKRRNDPKWQPVLVKVLPVEKMTPRQIEEKEGKI